MLQGFIAGVLTTLIVLTLIRVAVMRAKAEMLWEAGDELSIEDERFWRHGHMRGR